MIEKNTSELDKILGNTHASDIGAFLRDNQDSMIESESYFYTYVKDILKRNGISQQEAFLNADIPEKYGYKLLSGEKHTMQRDVILRICYAAKMTLSETQRALKIYGMPELYSKMARDALLMVCFNERPGSVLEVNSFLKKNQMQPLRSSGVQE